MIRHALRNLERTAVAKVLGDPVGPKRMIANPRAGERGGFAG
jgi:hypothetical protein